MSILSQIIAYSPNKIDTETKARAMVQGPRNMKLAQVPRSEMDNFNTPDLEQSPDSFLRPGETLEDFDVEFRRPNAQGGRIGFKGGYRVEDMTSAEIKSAQGNARKKGYSSKLGSESFTEFLANEYRSKAEQEKDFEKLKQKNLKEYQSKFSPKAISQKTGPLTKKEKLILYKSYDNIFKEEFDRLLNEGELFSKSDLNRSIINRIADENPTIDLTKGTGLDKIPGGGNEESKTLFENIDKKFTKKQKANFTTNTNALAYTKNQDRLLQALLAGNTDFDDLAEELGFNEGRLKGNVNKLMRNLAYTDKSQQPLFFKKYNQEDLEKARNAVFDSPTLESAYQRTALQSILASTVEGSKQRKDALNKYKEFNKFKAVMKENGIDPKLVAMDHAASYRAIKNGNVKNFLAMTPIMSDINAIKSTFDRRSQLNLRRMQDAITSGDNASYKKFLKNQKELEGVWKTMTGDQSSLGKIRIGATGKKKGITKIFDYGATSILDKNKDLLNELGDNLVIRKNIVKASTEGNLDEVSRIMFEGSEAEKPRPSKLPESFKNLNKPEMFKTENQIKKLLNNLETRGCGKSAGGRILFSNGSPDGTITTCAKKGVRGFIDDLKSGNYSKATKDILKGGGQFIKGALNPMELLKLRNLIGPAAMGFMAAFEGGVITDDVIRQGTPLNESLANNWLTKAFLPYTKDYAKAKNLLETGKVPANMKKYVEDVVTFNEGLKEVERIENMASSRIADVGGYGMIDGSSMYSQEQEDKDVNNLIKNMSTISEDVVTPGTAKALEMKALQDESEATRMAKKEFSPIFGFDKLKDVRTPGSTSFDYMPDETPKDLRPITYMDAEYKDTKLPLGLEQAYMNKFNIKPRDSLSNYFFKDSEKNVLEELTDEYNAFKRQEEASKYPGYFGTQDKFMEGGIASLNVKK